MVISPSFGLLLIGVAGLAALTSVAANQKSKALLAMVVVIVAGFLVWLISRASLLAPSISLGLATWAWFLTLPRDDQDFSRKLILLFGQLPLYFVGEYSGFQVGYKEIVGLDIFYWAVILFAPKKKGEEITDG